MAFQKSKSSPRMDLQLEKKRKKEARSITSDGWKAKEQRKAKVDCKPSLEARRVYFQATKTSRISKSDPYMMEGIHNKKLLESVSQATKKRPSVGWLE